MWAPSAQRVDVVIDGGRSTHPLSRGDDGFYRGTVGGIGPGSRYQFRINAELLVADPASRYQPEGVHGPSEIIDEQAYAWQDANWRGRPWETTILYELHIGTFTDAGTYRAAIEQLDALVDLGITAIELLPLWESPGTRNWGYDGVLPYAPEHCYGHPDDLKALIDAAHARSLMVFLDVVYNHFGPEGNYLHTYSPEFFTNRVHTPWGEALNFSDPGSESVRRFFLENALYWLDDFHFDGLRFDAIHEIYDASLPTFLEELATTIKRSFIGKREVHLVVENDDNCSQILSRHRTTTDRRFDAQWNDDAHHALHVTATGEIDHYYRDYAQDPIADLMRALSEGFVYQGEFSQHRGRCRGSVSTCLPLTSFVFFCQNHDQIGNRALGDRLGHLVRPLILQAVAALVTLSPMIPLIFMGEEWNASSPFLFFCDFPDELAQRVTEGRRREFSGFPQFANSEGQQRIPDPALLSTFLAAKLRWAERSEPPHASLLALYRTLFALRRREIIPRLARLPEHGVQSTRLDARSFLVSYQLNDRSRLHLFANLGEDRCLQAPPLPGRLLFATDAANATSAAPWTVRWSLQLPAASG